MISHIFEELHDEDLRQHIRMFTDDNSVLLSAGNLALVSSSVANCRYAFELTFKPIAVCFLRPQKDVIQLLDKSDYFTLSYFSSQNKHILDCFSPEPCIEIVKPMLTPLKNIYYAQSELFFECRKVFSLELILSKEIQTFLASEKKRSIYPGNEAPRMVVGEIIHGWHKIPVSAANNTHRRLPVDPAYEQTHLPEFEQESFDLYSILYLTNTSIA